MEPSDSSAWLALLRRDVAEWSARRAARKEVPGLFFADLSGADLGNADLSYLPLTGTSLDRTPLRKVDVAGTRFVGATGYELAKAKNGGQALR